MALFPGLSSSNLTNQVWLTANLPFSPRLKSLLPLWLPGYVQALALLPPEVVNTSLRISPAAIKQFSGRSIQAICPCMILLRSMGSVENVNQKTQICHFDFGNKNQSGQNPIIPDSYEDEGATIFGI
jgi:hypothetical protein